MQPKEELHSKTKQIESREKG